MQSGIFFFSSVSVSERMQAIKSMDQETLEKILQCDDVQDSVRKAIESRIRALKRKTHAAHQKLLSRM